MSQSLAKDVESVVSCDQTIITSRHDAVFVLAHYSILNFSAITCKQKQDPTALKLPEGWKKEGGFYSLDYETDSGVSLALRGVELGNHLVLNATIGDELVSVDVDLTAFYSSVPSTRQELLSPLSSVVRRIEQNLLKKLFSTQSDTRKSLNRSPESSLKVEGLSNPYLLPPTTTTPPHGGLEIRRGGSRGVGVGVGIGESDLHPFPPLLGERERGDDGGLQVGGNVVGPDHPIFWNGPPPGPGVPSPMSSIPPGARFDPYGPPVPRGGGGKGDNGKKEFKPDPDHLPPPGVYDHMFL